MAQLVHAIKNSQVTIVISGTGSGKTVIVPKVAAKVLSMQTGMQIGITNPKTTTTLANAEYAARCMDVSLGAETSIDIIKARKDFRLIIMSATIDAELFSNYFTNALSGCAQFNQSCVSEDCAAVICTELYSKASDDKKAAALMPAADPYVRKVIFATNVAESSFTFPGLGYVIDSGLELTSTWDPYRRCQTISKQFTTQAQIQQRSGRVGRQGPGKVYHLYSEQQLSKFNKFPDPHILGMDITQEVTAMMTLGDLASVVRSCSNLLTPPRTQQLTSALAMMHFYMMIQVTPINRTSASTFYQVPWFSKDLKSLTDISDRLNGHLTPMGSLVQEVMSGGRLGPWTALLFVIGAINGQADDAFVLSCVLEDLAADPSAILPLNRDPEKSAPELHPDLITSSSTLGVSDHATLLNIYRYASTPVVNGAFDSNILVICTGYMGRLATCQKFNGFLHDFTRDLKGCNLHATVLGIKVRQDWIVMDAKEAPSYLPTDLDGYIVLKLERSDDMIAVMKLFMWTCSDFNSVDYEYCGGLHELPCSIDKVMIGEVVTAIVWKYDCESG
ncbi:putative ATP-dependent RNA [Tetrabaena socialis]|uniref:Putative ATP-dependent RNA n=1 Tax=Tetrabaena socialis TaxID=47790 RepID=A0A2J8AJ60_9CHLO|nr:putative ATP-dependent RNA [Tetrabaena socialis]|eukprot:PNH12550.1 putative ATP-dependent RNA [Tetrabaena socialis]